MKICSKCGAKQQDHRGFCLDCGERLGDPLSAAEEKQARAEMNVELEKLYNRRDPLYVSKWDKLGGGIALLLAVVALIVIMIAKDTIFDIRAVLLVVIFTIGCLFEAFFPKFGWELEKLRLSSRFNGIDDITPSGFYFAGRKIAIWGTVVLNGVLLVLFLWTLFQGNEPAMV